MDVTQLAAVMREVVDMEYLSSKLVSEPLVRSADGTWRALSLDEARKVGRLVGEAIGARLAQPPS